MYKDEENNKTIQLRLPARMKDDLRALADRKGLNVSQLVRNYIESLLVSTPRLPQEPKDTNQTSGDRMFTLRLPRELHDKYKSACAEASILASKYPRQIITDLSSFLLQETPSNPAPLSDTLRYLELFLVNELAKGGLRYVRTYERPQLNHKVPLIQQIDDFTFVVNQGKIQYVIQFEPCSKTQHNQDSL